MQDFTTDSIRTIALVGQSGAGKTSLVDAMLFRARNIKQPGTIEQGNTVCDYDPQEKAIGHSIRSAVVHVDPVLTEIGSVRIHVIDTPGAPEYVGQALPALDAVKSVVVVVDATKGIELMTRRMMKWAEDRKLCRLILINKIDAEGVDLPKLLADLKETFGEKVIPINLPTKGMEHVVDCYDDDSGVSDIMSVRDVHRAFIERIVEVDDETMERYLDEGYADPASLHAPLTKALRMGHIIPVCFASAKNLIGLRDLMKVIIRHFPSPLEANEPLFENTKGEEQLIEPDDRMPVVAHVFKVISDPFVGKIASFRVHQGSIVPGTALYVDDQKKSFKIAKPLLMQGKDLQEVDVLHSGDIGAVTKVDEIQLGSVLHSTEMDANLRMKKLDMPRPMYGVAITPKTRGDESRMSEILKKVLAEDPTLSVERDVVLNEQVLRGLTEMHIRMVLQRMKDVFKLEVQTASPSVPYRETIAGKAEGHHRHRKQTGGAGQYGEVYLRVEPLPRGGGFEFSDESKGGVIPYNFIPAVERGVREVLDSGFVAGYPIQDVKVVVFDGSHHPVDSKEVAFVAAGKKAFMDALSKANPIVLEPVVALEITTPEAFMGDIIGDLSSRRGQVTDTKSEGAGTLEILANAPLAELDGYAASLHAMTQGAGSFTMDLAFYQPVPASVQAELASKYVRKADED